MLAHVTMETVVLVAIAVLATIFVGSLVAVVVICSNRKCRKTDYFSRPQQEVRSVFPYNGYSLTNETGYKIYFTTNRKW